MSEPCHSHRAPPKASPAAIQSPLSTAAPRKPVPPVPLVKTRSAAMSTAKMASVPAQAHNGTVMVA